jgi:hypothetical protein
MRSVQTLFSARALGCRREPSVPPVTRLNPEGRPAFIPSASRIAFDGPRSEGEGVAVRGDAHAGPPV